VRIALDCRSVFHGMGGIGCYTWSLLKEYATLCGEHEVVCYFTHLSPPEPVSLPANFNVRIFEAGMIDERFDQLVLPGLLARDRIDLYHNPTFAVPLVRTSSKVVATIHDVVFRRHPELVEPKLRSYLDTATHRACKLADRLVTVSEFSRREIVKLYSVDPDRIDVIPNGVHQATAARGGRVDRFGLASGGYVLYVGSVERKKNLDLLLEGYQRMTENAPGLLLALVGSKSDDSLPSRLRERGLGARVRVLGYVSPEDLEILYANARLFVYPSLYEGFGLPPLEAMARGVPTIVANTSSLPEVVGDGAELVDPHDADGLAKLMLALSTDEPRREALAARGRERAKNFTWRRSAERHLEIYTHANLASCV